MGFISLFKAIPPNMSYPRASLTGGFSRDLPVSGPPLIPNVPPLPTTGTPLAPPLLCRDPAHAVLITPSAAIPPMYLSWIDSGVVVPGNMQSVSGILDEDGDLILRLSAATWQMIRDALAPAPSLPLFTFVPQGDALTFLCLGIQQDYTFRVSTDYPYDYVTGSSSGIRLRRRGATSSITHSSHPNHRFASAFRITFLV